MSLTQDLIKIEKAGWKSLKSGGDAAVKHYDKVLASDVLMLFPGMVIDDRKQVVDSMKGAKWDSFELSDERVLPLSDESAVLAYKAKASRQGEVYTALFNSTYVWEDGDWHLALHQQTPEG